MDLYKSESKIGVEETHRRPLAPSEKNNAAPTVAQKPRAREIMSRYKSSGVVAPAPSDPVVSRRSSSPGVNRIASSPGPVLPKRSQSAERRRPSTPSSPSPSRPSTPPSPSRPSTPSTDMQISARRLSGNRTADGLWPSMRSLSVSFQADSYSIPVARKEKPATHSSSDHTLRSSANAGPPQKQAENPAVQRKATPERKRTPLRGKNGPEQSENSKPMENHQLRWPGRVSARLSANSLSRSVDLTDRINKTTSLPLPGQRGVSPARKMRASDGQRGTSPIRKMPASDVQQGVSPTIKISVSDGQRGVSPSRKMLASDGQRGVSPTRRISASDAGMGRGLQKSTSEVAGRIISEIGRNLIDDMTFRTSGSSKVFSTSINVSSNPTERSSITRSSRALSSPLPGLHRPQSPNRDLFSSHPLLVLGACLALCG
ncbi:hypothetical protein QJS10_CPA02g01333 [Acorus calamus]|uniref:Uncharacterized protein n=1 Tax=Acorus calamus TaxID=4465 RepID=A0AAV9FGG4_ACOCL|nr:hypothetical protein QJS10_CPA02g01333 [Acorus calamus]